MSIAHCRTVVGSLYGLMRNALGLNVATPLESQEMSCTVAPDRRLVVLGHEPIAGYARDHGTVANEAAMLALHTLDGPTLLAEPTFVAPGDSCLRADDPGWRWHCIAGHGTTLADWERRPLAGALGAYQPLDTDLTAIAAQGLSDYGLAWLALSGAAAAKDALSISRTDIGDASTVGLALMALSTPAAPKIAQINADGTVTTIDVPTGGGGGLDSDALIDLLGPLGWWRADTGVEEAEGDASEDGDGVSRWLDQSGHGYHLMQSTSGYRPTYEADEVAGLPVIRFSAHHLTNTSLPLDLQNHTMIVVARSTATTGQHYGRLACVGLPASGIDCIVSTAQVWTFDNTGTPEVRVNSGNANYEISLSATQVSRPAALAAFGYRITRGVAVLSASDLISVGGTNRYSTASVGINIGCQWKDGAAQPATDSLHADLCEIVVFDRALGSSLFGLILSALARKWGM